MVTKTESFNCAYAQAKTTITQTRQCAVLELRRNRLKKGKTAQVIKKTTNEYNAYIFSLHEHVHGRVRVRASTPYLMFVHEYYVACTPGKSFRCLS